MFDDLKIHEWWFLGLAATAGFLLVRHILNKFSGDGDVAGNARRQSANGSADAGAAPESGATHQSDEQQRKQFKQPGPDFNARGSYGEQSDWFRRGKNDADQHFRRDADQQSHCAGSAEDSAASKQNSSSVRPWYQVLEVSSLASLEDIKRAYQRKIRQYHPDKVAGLGPEFAEIANAKAKEINRAYEQGCMERDRQARYGQPTK